MKDCCSSHHCETAVSQHYRYILWTVFAINFGMFLVEIISGVNADSASLLADSLDFLGDASNYGISLFVLSMALSVRAKASLLKGYTMAIFGVWVLGSSAYLWWLGSLPSYHKMSLIGILALVANVISDLLLYKYREGDSNMRGVWICSRNDAIGNLLVIAAAGAVYFTQSNLPDLLVATVIGGLNISGAVAVIHQAQSELKVN